MSPSSPDSVSAQDGMKTNREEEEEEAVLIELPGHPVTGPPIHSPEELVAKMEVDDMGEDEGEFFISDERVADKMETVEALLSLSSSTRSPGSSPEKTLITILPAHNPDKGEQSR